MMPAPSILAIDPGSRESAWLILAEETPTAFGIDANEVLIEQFRTRLLSADDAVIEWMAPRGMPTSAEEFETLYWVGRFVEALYPQEVARLERGKIKLHLCGSRAAKDANVRATLIDRFGGIGGKAEAVGTVKRPGPLHGVANDVWAALAVAVTWYDLR